MSAPDQIIVGADTVELEHAEADVVIAVLGDQALDHVYGTTFEDNTAAALGQLRDRLSLYLRLLDERDAR